MSKGYLHTRCTGLIKYDSRSSERDCGNDLTPVWNTKTVVSTCNDRIRVWEAIQCYVRSQNSLNSGYSENFLCTKSRVPSWSMTYVVYTCEYSSFERKKNEKQWFSFERNESLSRNTLSNRSQCEQTSGQCWHSCPTAMTRAFSKFLGVIAPTNARWRTDAVDEKNNKLISIFQNRKFKKQTDWSSGGINSLDSIGSTYLYYYYYFQEKQ